MNGQRIVSFVLVCSIMLCGILMGSPLTAFFDPISIAIFMGLVCGSILWSHSVSDVLGAFGTFLSTAPVDAHRSRRDHNTFMRLAKLCSAVCWIGPLIGIIQILGRLEEPSAIGPALAIVFLTIFYGTIAGELLFRPAAAACLNQTGSSTESPSTEISTSPIAFHPRKIVFVLLMGGLVAAGLSFSGTSQIFTPLTSMGLVVSCTLIGLFVSHPASNIRQVLRSVFGPETMPPEHAQQGAAMFHRLAELAVAIGFLGTLIGLVQMLQDLSDPTMIGPAVSVALLTVFYGVLLSEVAFRAAVADCLKRGGLHTEEWSHRYPNRTLGIVGPVVLVVFAFALLLISFGFPYLGG